MLREICPKSISGILDINPREELRNQIEEDRQMTGLYLRLRCFKKQRNVRITFEYLLEIAGMTRWSHLDAYAILERCKIHNLTWKLKVIIYRLLNLYNIKDVMLLS